ncbi:MAG: hypothetical protein KDD48_07695 [Bdellovibrionales bacterium]|nr:hypothetical protein [Bdellovibrionales bacterium]
MMSLFGAYFLLTHASGWLLAGAPNEATMDSGTRIFSWKNSNNLQSNPKESFKKKSNQFIRTELRKALTSEQPVNSEDNLTKRILDDNTSLTKQIALSSLKLPLWIKSLYGKKTIDEKSLKDGIEEEASRYRQRVQSGAGGLGGKKKSDAQDHESDPGPFSYHVHAFFPGKTLLNTPIRDSNVLTQDIILKVAGPPDYSIFSQQDQPDRILPLGLGGIIILEVDQGYVVNGEGDDFVIFENPFIYDGKVFAETAVVSVAEENIETSYRAFPCQSRQSPFEGCAGTKVVAYHPDLPLSEVGGDLFDLKDVSLEKIKFIRIQDTGDHSAMTYGKEGFDLDSIALIHTRGF